MEFLASLASLNGNLALPIFVVVLYLAVRDINHMKESAKMAEFRKHVYDSLHAIEKGEVSQDHKIGSLMEEVHAIKDDIRSMQRDDHSYRHGHGDDDHHRHRR